MARRDFLSRVNRNNRSRKRRSRQRGRHNLRGVFERLEERMVLASDLFVEAAEIVSGAGTRSTAHGDLDGDGDLDLVAINANANTVSVLENNGVGGFTQVTTIPVGNDPQSVAVGDVNSDGHLDVLTANNDDDTFSLALGNGDQTFQTRSDFAGGSGPRSIQVADVDSDGNLDVLLSNIGDDHVSVSRGVGDGTFQTLERYAVGAQPQAVIVGDVTGDGVADLLTANRDDDSISVLTGSNDGSFHSRIDYAAGDGAFFIQLGDVDEDGIIDAVTADRFADAVSFLKGQGGGAFASPVAFSVGPAPEAITLDDADGDGHLDIFAANRDGDTLSFLKGNGNGTFDAQSTLDTGAAPVHIGRADLDGDGDLDAYTANFDAASVSTFSLEWIDPTIEWISPTGGDWNDAANWSTGQIPGHGDVVLIDVPGDVEITGPSQFVTLFGLYSHEKIVMLGGALDLDGPSILAGGLRLHGGVLSGSGDVRLRGESSWTGGGVFFFQGVVTNEGTFTMTGGGDRRLHGVLRNAGQMINSLSQKLEFDEGTLINLPSGVFEHRSNELKHNGGTNLFVNSGLFLKPAGLAFAEIGVPIDNSGGTVAVTGGELLVNAGGTSNNGTYRVGVNGKLTVANGAHVFTGDSRFEGDGAFVLNNNTGLAALAGATVTFDFTSDSAELRGSHLSSAGQFINDGNLTWTGTELHADGGFLNNGLFTVPDGGDRRIFGPFVTAGTVVDNFTGVVEVVNATLTIAEGGVYELRTGKFDHSGSGNLVNYGTLRSSGAGERQTDLPFNNNGLVEVLSGNLLIRRPGTHDGGTFTVSQDALLRFRDATQTFVGSSTITGPGSAQLETGIMQVSNGSTLTYDLPAPGFRFWNGELRGTGTHRNTGVFQWNAGTLRADGQFLNEGTFNLTGSDRHYLWGNFNNSGPFNHTATGDLEFIDATFNNTAAGVYHHLLGQLDHDGGFANFNNLGTYRADGGASQVTIDVVFNNAGTNVLIDSGTLLLQRGGTQTDAIFTVADGTLLRFGGQTYTFVGDSTITGPGSAQLETGIMQVSNGSTLTYDLPAPGFRFWNGELRGTGTHRNTGVFQWNAGTLRADGQFLNEGTFNLTGNDRHYLWGNFNNSGPFNHTATGDLEFIDATFNNTAAGVYHHLLGQLDHDGGFANFNNLGTYRADGGASQVTIDVVFNNAGTNVSIDSGTLLLQRGGTQTDAIFTVADGTLLRFGGQTYTFVGDSTITGPGSAQLETGIMQVSNGSTLTYDLPAPGFRFWNGELRGTGTHRNTGVFQWNAGTLRADGQFLNEGTFNLTGNDRHYLWGNFNNSGPFNHTATGDLEFIDATFNNTAAGVYHHLLGQLDHDGGFANFNNLGTYRADGGASQVTIDVVFNNAGTNVSIDSGTLLLQRGGTQTDATFTVADGTLLRFGGQTYTFVGDSTITGPGSAQLETGIMQVSNGSTLTYDLPAPGFRFWNGELRGTGTHRNTGVFQWNAGTLRADGQFLNEGTFNLTGNDRHYLWGNFNNSGPFNHTATGDLEFIDATFNNTAAGVYHHLLGQLDHDGGFANFNNLGTYRADGGASQVTIDVVFNNAGTNVLIDSGTLLLQRGGTQTDAIFTVADGTLLRFGGQTYTFVGDSTITGPGSAQLETGIMQVSNGSTLTYDLPAPGFRFWNGELRGTGTHRNTGVFQWNAGTLRADGQFLNEGTFNLTGNDRHYLWGNFNNLGVFDSSATGDLEFINATFNNSPTGLFSHTQGLLDRDGGTNAFNNQGTYQANAGTGQVTVDVLFNNTGTVETGTSTLFLSDRYTHADGEIRIDGGTFASTSAVDIQSGGVFGTGTLVAALTNSGTVSPGGLGIAGQLVVNGSYTQAASGRLAIDIGGPTPGTNSDLLSVVGAADVGGILELQGINDFVPTPGQQFDVITYGLPIGTGQFDQVLGNPIADNAVLTPETLADRISLVTGPDLTGPRVAAIEALQPEATSVLVTFSEHLTASSFTTADVTLTDPDGPVSVNAVVLVNADNQFRLEFPPLVRAGAYTLTIGPDIADRAGNPMDQNADGTAGDAFTLTTSLIDTTNPSIDSLTPAGPVATDVSSVGVTFSEIIRPATFTAADVAVTRPDGSAVGSGSISITADSATAFTISFSPALDATGVYDISIGPDIEDFNANKMTEAFETTLTIDPTGRFVLEEDSQFSVSGIAVGGNSLRPRGVAWIADEQRVVLSGGDQDGAEGTSTIVETDRNGTVLSSFQVPLFDFDGVDVQADGNLALSKTAGGGVSGGLYIFDRTGSQLDLIAIDPPSGQAKGVQSLAGGEYLIVDNDGVPDLRRFNAAGTVLSTLALGGKVNGDAEGFGLDPFTGHYFFADDVEDELVVIDPISAEVVARIHMPPFGLTDVEGIAFDRLNGQVIVSSDEDQKVAFFDRSVQRIELSASPAIAEGGTAHLTVRRFGDTSGSLQVDLTSDYSDVTVPATVEFLAGEAEKNVTVSAVDNTVAFDTLTVTLSATGDLLLPQETTIELVDEAFAPASVNTFDITGVLVGGRELYPAGAAIVPGEPAIILSGGDPGFTSSTIAEFDFSGNLLSSSRTDQARFEGLDVHLNGNVIALDTDSVPGSPAEVFTFDRAGNPLRPPVLLAGLVGEASSVMAEVNQFLVIDDGATPRALVYDDNGVQLLDVPLNNIVTGNAKGIDYDLFSWMYIAADDTAGELVFLNPDNLQVVHRLDVTQFGFTDPEGIGIDPFTGDIVVSSKDNQLVGRLTRDVTRVGLALSDDATTITEGSPTELVVTRYGKTDFAQDITLASNFAGLQLASVVSFADGESEKRVPLLLTDDTNPQVTSRVRIVATAPSIHFSSLLPDIVDDDVINLAISVPEQVQVGAPASIGTITVADPISIGDLQFDVTATGNDHSTFAIGTIESGAVSTDLTASTTFPTAFLDTVTLTVTPKLVLPSGETIVFEQFAASRSFEARSEIDPSLTITGNASVSELGAPITLTVTRDDFDRSQPLTVSLSLSGAVDEATVPTDVTIAANETSATFNVQPVHDSVLDGSQIVTVTASATGLTSDSHNVTVTDSDFVSLQASNVQVPATAAVGGQITIAWYVENSGNVATPGTWRERVFLRSASGSLYLLGESDVTDSIGVSESSARQATFEVPIRGIGGDMTAVVEFSNVSFTATTQSAESASSVTIPLALVIALPDGQPTSFVEGSDGYIDIIGSGKISSQNIVGVSLNSNLSDLVLDANSVELGHIFHSPHLVRVGFDVLKDLLVEGDEVATIFATAAGYQGAALDITVLDNVPPDLRADTDIGSVTENVTYNNNILAEFFVDDDAFHGDYQFVLSGADADKFYVRQEGDHFELRFDGSFEFDAETTSSLSVSLSVKDIALDADQTFGSLAYTFGVTDVPEPDLIVTEVVMPDGPIIADPATLSVTWDVKNDGLDTVTGWKDRVQLIDENGHVRVSASFLHLNMLAPGETIRFTETLLLPPSEVGRFRANVTTDHDDLIEEYDFESNNSRTSDDTTDVMVVPYADLVVDEFVSTSGVSAGLAEPVGLQWEVSNQGIGITNVSNWDESVYIATDDQRGGLRRIAGFTRAGALDVGQSYQRNVDVTIPADLSPGDYYLFLNVSGPFEFLFTDNWSDGVPVQVTDVPRPDLVVTEIINPSTGLEGTNIDVTWRIRNDGPVATDAIWTDQIRLRKEGETTTSVLGTFNVIEQINPGNTRVRTESVRLPERIQGSYDIIVTTNAGGQLFEKVTSNNQLTSLEATLVSPQPRPDLRVDTNTVVVPDSVDAGGTFSVEFDVLNLGTADTSSGAQWVDEIYLSLDGRPSGDDLLLGRLPNISALGQNEAYHQITNSIEVPILFRGDIFVLFITDANDQVAEWPQEGNNTTIVPITVNPFALSDLVLSDVALPGQSIAGATFDVSYSVDNLGTGETDVAAWSEQIWLTTDKDRPNPGRGDLLLATVAYDEGVLAKDAGYDRTVSVTIPESVDAAQYYIIPWVDPFDQVVEESLAENLNPDVPNDFNGSNFKARSVDILALREELVYEDLQVTAAAKGGEEITVTWTVRNQGNGESRNDQPDRIFISETPNRHADGNVSWDLGSFPIPKVLQPGRVVYQHPDDQAGTERLRQPYHRRNRVRPR